MAASYRQREEEAIEREMGILPREKVTRKDFCESFLCKNLVAKCLIAQNIIQGQSAASRSSQRRRSMSSDSHDLTAG